MRNKKLKDVFRLLIGIAVCQRAGLIGFLFTTMIPATMDFKLLSWRKLTEISGGLFYGNRRIRT